MALAAGYAHRYNTNTLTPRLLEVAHRILAGYGTSKELSVDLDISIKTADTLKAALFGCLGIHSTVELIVKERDGQLVIPGWGWRDKLLEAAKEKDFLQYLENTTNERDAQHRIAAAATVRTRRAKKSGRVHPKAVRKQAGA